MDSSTLNRFALEGFAGLPATDLGRLVQWSRDRCSVTADARYCLLADGLHLIDNWWSRHDQSGGVPASQIDAIDDLIKSSLPAVISAPTLDEGATLARDFCATIPLLLTEPPDWLASGQAQLPDE